MPRTAGSKNKPKNNITMSEYMDSEDIFLQEMVSRKAFWTAKAKELEVQKKDNTREKDYANYYRLGINQFSNDDKPIE
jgi:hypothetical protein